MNFIYYHHKRQSILISTHHSLNLLNYIAIFTTSKIYLHNKTKIHHTYLIVSSLQFSRSLYLIIHTYICKLFNIIIYCSVVMRDVNYGLSWWLSWQTIWLQCRAHRFNPWIRKITWRRAWEPLQYSCLENSMDRSLAGYSPWGCKELDTTEKHDTSC